MNNKITNLKTEIMRKLRHMFHRWPAFFAAALTVFSLSAQDTPQVSTAESPIWYKIQLPSWSDGTNNRAQRYLSNSGTAPYTVANSAGTDTDANLWRLEGADLNSVKIISRSGNKELFSVGGILNTQVTFALLPGGGTPWKIYSSSAFTGSYYIGIAATPAMRINAGGATPGSFIIAWGVGLWNEDDNASSWLFTRVSFAPSRTITLEAKPAAGGTVSGGGTATGAILCTATPNAGYMFVNWTNKATGEVVSTSATYSENGEGDKTLVANFAKDPKLNRTGWTATADSYTTSGPDGPAGNAIDSNNATWWHSQWSPTSTAQPHWIMFDLGKKQSFTSFNYISRNGMTNASGNGNIGQYELYASDNAADVKGYLESAKVNSGTFTYNGGANAQEHLVKLGAPVKGRYVLLKSITAANGAEFASCAEFYLYLDAFVVSVNSADESMGDVYIDTEGNKSKELSTDGNETATLTAVPTEGYHFVSWTLDGAEVSTDAVYTTDLVTESREYVANFAFTPVTPRAVVVLSADARKGSVAITDPATEEPMVTTGEIVTVEATPANSDNFFVNWTDAENNVVSTNNIYKYDKAPMIILTANFVTRYVITANQAEGGTMTVKDGDRTIATGDRVADGSVITISIIPNNKKGLVQLLINGVDVYAEGQDVYTTTVTKATTIVPVYGDPKCRLYYSYEGAGYIEVWSSDTYQEEGPFPVDPDGEQYGYGVLLPFGENIYVFAYPYGDGKLVSLTINGVSKYTPDDPEDDITKYGDVQHDIPGPMNIKAVFSGVSTGVESSVSATDVKVYGVSGGIVIDSESAVTAEIFTAGGELIATPSVSGNSTVSIASGFYIVRVNGASYKVSVK